MKDNKELIIYLKNGSEIHIKKTNNEQPLQGIPKSIETEIKEVEMFNQETFPNNSFLSELCTHCGLRYGSHLANGYYDTRKAKQIPPGACPELPLDMVNHKWSPTSHFKPSGKYEKQK